ncbi:DUF1007 family protein [Moellerella wisconsensis]|uniref:Putative exported protein n=1 Tax=Moellerella wisconsensis ATCC 35017 TaxID=1354267 RepID=A0A0N0I9I4_9GAMM|nr:DUF1007 family protein [Moellerella wisconsensis]KPD01861.1 putative exported protein [Moellerella wisconsensis ATCC 35017]VFS54498.1 ABC-type uncharacterized transport system, periplasmic component [Moellerella wisconsensis]
MKLLKTFIIYLSMLYSLSTQAHPHSFITLETEFEVHNQQLTGISFSWKMDPITSADILSELNNVKPNDKQWKKQAADIMANILSENYFSELYHQKNKVQFKALPDSYSLQRERSQLVFNFSVSLAKPIQLQQNQFELLTYDPTFFIDMSYPKQDAIHLPLEMAAVCEIQLNNSKPPQSAIEYATSLDNQDIPEKEINLGLQFAQRVKIICR